jgi:hypothetical protein
VRRPAPAEQSLYVTKGLFRRSAAGHIVAPIGTGVAPELG